MHLEMKKYKPAGVVSKVLLRYLWKTDLFQRDLQSKWFEHYNSGGNSQTT